MKKYSWILVSVILVFLSSCNGDNESVIDNSTKDTLKTQTDQEVNSEWQTVDTDSLFQIDLPVNMLEQNDLNQDASLQYAYIKKVSGVVKEHYVIIMTDTKAEIDSYNLAVEFDAMSFSQAALEAVVGGYDTYEILTTEPVIEKINNLDCVIYEIEASLGEIHTYHMLGVFEGEKAFYQVLTWTLSDQQSEFHDAMEQMIGSFKES